MGKRFCLTILVAGVLSASGAFASTHYVAANGSDSNDGVTQASAWLHAPGMTGCSGNCSSYRPLAGDQFIFRGGDTWHYSAGSPVGLPWTWTWNGANGNNIYIGTDQSWFSGSSFTRPILTMDNPLSSVLVSSCTFDDSNKQALVLNANFVTFDDFEFTGKCWSGNPDPNASLNITNARNSIIKNNYFHGWSAAIGSLDVHRSIRGLLLPSPTFNEIAYNVIDGSDSSRGTTTAANQCSRSVNGTPCQSGFGIYGDGYNVHDNVLRYLSNGIVTNGFYTVHDNLFEYMWNSYDGNTHPNVVESGTGGLAGVPFYFYNNVIRHTRQNVTMWVMFDQASYEFNNVFFDNFGDNIDCLEYSAASNSSTPVLYFYNNTLDATSVGNGVCKVNFAGGNATTPTWHGTANFQNNHFIGFSTAQLSSVWQCQSPATCTVNDNGSQVFQSESTANGQGYTSSNYYAPTASSNSTVGMGANLADLCSTFSSDNRLCSGTGAGAMEQAGQGGFVAVSPAVALMSRPQSGSWDVGAFEFSSSSGAGKPNPPTGLRAVVQ